MTVASFAALAPSPEEVASERYELMRRGVAYGDWRLMAKWQRAYHLQRANEEAKALRQQAASGGLKGVVGTVLGKVLGV